MGMREENEKSDLKLNIQKVKIMAYGPISSWQTDEEKVETVTGFIFLGSKISADSDCSQKIKTFAPWGGGGGTITNLDSLLKIRDTTLPKVCIVKAMFFPVIMYRCESWTIKEAQH